MNDYQKKALDQLQKIEEVGSEFLKIVSSRDFESNKINYLKVEISINCKTLFARNGGLKFNEIENFNIYIHPNFPFIVPDVEVNHYRFLGCGHVQNFGKEVGHNHICLYLSISTEWNTSYGMNGFIGRLKDWLVRASKNRLEADGEALHPPIAYSNSDKKIVFRKNTPGIIEDNWMGLMKLSKKTEKRFDVIDWIELDNSDDEDNDTYFLGATILLSGSMPFEYPKKLSELIKELIRLGVNKRRLLLILQIASIYTKNNPLFVCIGTPSRGVKGGVIKQHLASFEIEKEEATILLKSISKYSEDEIKKTKGIKEEKKFWDWAENANVKWCRVFEDRDEVLKARDANTPISWFKNKKVAIWGCGAIGSYLADFLTRSGIKSVIFIDNDVVTPGVITRQLYKDISIGTSKSAICSFVSEKINPLIETKFFTYDLIDNLLNDATCMDDVDLIIDTTSNNLVLELSEIARKKKPIPMATLSVGHNAKNGIVTYSDDGFSGGVGDVNRKLKISVCNSGDDMVKDEFWPEKSRNDIFQPEPGCSDSTFTGSASDIASLAGVMINHLGNDLSKNKKASAHVVSTSVYDPSNKFKISKDWEKDFLLMDEIEGYEVRITNSSLRRINAWIKRNARLKGSDIETGGLLFGERDNNSKIIWINEVSGPSSDSEHSQNRFISGINDVESLNAEKTARTRGSVSFVGMWHSHPVSEAIPSQTDIQGMNDILESVSLSQKTLLIIIGHSASNPSLGAYLFNRNVEINKYVGDKIKNFPDINSVDKIGIALSGGGSRAVAFHLGCMRALNQYGFLKDAKVISSVSGGSIISGIYASTKEDFSQFEKNILNFLRDGIQTDILLESLKPLNIIKSILTFFLSGIPALFFFIYKKVVLILFYSFAKSKGKIPDWIKNIKPPFLRWSSRTVSFQKVLNNKVFNNLLLRDIDKDGKDFIFNASEMRSGNAFRFGNIKSSCSKYGVVKNNEIKLSTAVSASAAYPALLPSIDVKMKFLKRGKEKNNRVLLSDGGIYDNLGLTCLFPGRSLKYSNHVYDLDYIISCDASYGLFDNRNYPYWWTGRIVRSFESLCRKAQDGVRSRLFSCIKDKTIKGSIMPYLGLQDSSLRKDYYIPDNFIKREDVVDYPTDFAPMNDKDIEKISLRGEQITQLLIDRYLSEL